MSSKPQLDHEGLQVQLASGIEVAYSNAPEVFLSKKTERHQRDTSTIWSFSKPASWISITVIVGIIIAIAIGTGVGIGVSRHRNGSGASSSTSSATISNSTPTPTIPSSSSSTSSYFPSLITTPPSTTTTPTPSPFPTLGLLALDCPGLDDTILTSSIRDPGMNFTYAMTCNENFPGNDIQIRNATTVDACLDLCASWTNTPSIYEPSCNGIVFNANLTSSIPAQGGNCLLKSSVANGVLVDNGGFTVVAGVWTR